MKIRGLGRKLVSPAMLATVLAMPAWADVSLRIEGRPASSPIQVFVTVTDPGGVPVSGLTAADFEIRIDGVLVPINQSNVTLPPSQDPDQHVSIVFAMDYTTSVTDIALDAMRIAVIEFIDAMNPGDEAAIVKFNSDTGASVVAGFTTIDDGANDQALADAVMADYPGDGSNILDATLLAVDQFAGATLPPGPKAVILLTDGLDNDSDSSADDVIGSASSGSIPIFTIGVGNPDANALELLDSLAGETGGGFYLAPTDQDISDAYASVSALLGNEYLISIPNNSIDDCAEHDLEVTVSGEAPVTAQFTRRVCDTEPDQFSFTSATNFAPGATATSNAVTITGIEVPAHISVIQGRYSIGCNDTFTDSPGTIENGQTVCVRHQTSASFSTSKTTTLTVGGVAATFTSTTHAQGAGGGGGGGGGAAGLFELLLACAALLLRGRRAAAPQGA